MPHVTLTAKEQQTVDAPPELLVNGRLNLYSQVTKKNYFQTRLTPDGLKIQAGNHIGVIPLNDDVTLRVTPRVPLANLARLLSTINHTGTVLPGLMRTYDTEQGMYPSLVALYATSLRTLLEAVSQNGLLRRYYQRDEDYTAPRGRINVTRTWQTAAPRESPHVSTSYFERTLDTPENQALLAAVLWLHRYAKRNVTALSPTENRLIQRDLNRSQLLLRGVTHNQQYRFITDPVVTGGQALPALRQDYRPLLDLALTILSQKAVIIDRAGQRLQLDTLLINMDDVFEDYTREVLRRTAKHENWPERVLDGNLGAPAGARSFVFTQENDDEVTTKPDVVLQRPATDPRRRHPLVIDAKYRPVDKRIDRRDLEQVALYGLTYNAPHVVVLQPHSGKHSRGLRTAGTVQGITAHVYAIDLSGDLDLEEAAFANTMRGLCQSVS